MKIFLVLSLVFGVVYGQSTDVQRCSSTAADLPVNAYIAGCTDPPCQLVIGDYANIDVVFRAPHTIRSMRTIANAFLLLLPITYDLGPEAITCNSLQNTYCPLVKDEIVIYTLRMYIDPIFPEISVNLEVHVEDENSNAIWCLRTRISVIRGRANNGTLALE